jgi:CheY-like chemotaxis protein
VLSVSQPDGVVLDLNMPRVDGFAVLKILARRPPAQQPRIMVLTARRAAGDVRRCVELGAADYLAKPFSDELLLRRVARLVAPERRSHAPRPSFEI